MLTEDELLRDYRYERSSLEEQGDELKRGEQSVNNLIEQKLTACLKKSGVTLQKPLNLLSID
ncbi:MAG: hypothetical protein LBS33_00900 [Streptococcaceae bacterium]|jgi:hypothetical protein|nr:hypothetical protein [Streptococcaceae bacterium]